MFNFGAFAGGLATAIQTQQKLNLEEKKYDDDIKASNAKLKQEENKALAEILKQVDEHNKNVSNLSLGMSKAEDETQYNTYVSELKAANENFKANAKSQLDNYANTPLGQKMETLFNGARISDVEQVEKTTIKDANSNVVETYIPQSLVQDKDNLVLMENGRFGIAQVGQDGKISGYQPTNIAPIKFKPETDMYTKGLELFTPGGDSVKVYSPNEAKQYEQQGFGRVKPKIDSSPKVEIKIGDKGKDYANIATDARTKLKNIESGGKITPDDESNLMASEFTLTETMDTKQKDKRQEVRDTLDTVQNLKEIKNTTKRLMDSGVKGGIAQDAVVGVMKYVGTGGKFSDLADMDDAKFKSITGLEAASTAQKMEIIKSLSGLSYTDKQAEMMNKITGDGWGKTNEAKYNAMDGYIKDQERKLKGIASTNNTFSSTSPYTSAMVLKTLGVEASQPKQVGLAGNLPVMQDEKGEYIEINGVKKYKGVK